MIQFLDGPAKGTSLCLNRAPMFLRVVIDPRGQVEALDQLDDTPEADEKIHVYRCTRGEGGGCRRGVMAQYRLYEAQPSGEEARDNENH